MVKARRMCIGGMMAVFQLLVLSSAGLCSVLYVDDTATGGNSGSSWQDAYVDLHVALSVAVTGDELRVAQGEYYTSPPGGLRTATFALRNGIQLFGGYRGGTGEGPDDRDWSNFASILSGDIGRNDGERCVNSGDNSFHVVTALNIDSTALLDGFRVVGGSASGGESYGYAGGGMLLIGGNPVIANCGFEFNCGQYGAGMYCRNARLELSGCEFSTNYAWGGGRGGGLAIGDSCKVHLEGCTFSGNAADGWNTEGVGGGVYNEGGQLTVNNCLFDGNSASNGEFSSSIYPPLGGGLFSFSMPVSITNSRFYLNESSNGGGVFSFGQIEVYNSIFAANNAMEFVTPNGIGVGGGGGAIFVGAYYPDTSKVVNCVLYGNTAHNTGGVELGYEFYGNQFGFISNCVLWGNTDINGNYGKAQYAGVKPEYSCVENLFLAPPDDDPPAPEDVPGCIDINPLFVDANGADNALGTLDDDFHLMALSPCIDAGDNDMLPTYLAVDMDGQQRRSDDPNTTDTGNGVAPIVEMGVFEIQGIAPLQPPTNLVISAVGADAVLFWAASPSAASYNVYRDSVSAVAVIPANLIGASVTTTYVDAGAFNDPSYARFYVVTAVAP